jgi:hypothetical protein
VLATDALAQWLIRCVVPGEAWAGLLAKLAAEGDAAFRRLVEAERASGALRDDDVTLVVITSAWQAR